MKLFREGGGGGAGAAEVAARPVFFTSHLSRTFSVFQFKVFQPFNDLSTARIHSEGVCAAHNVSGASVADLSAAGADLRASVADLSRVSLDNAAAHRLVQLRVLIAGVGRQATAAVLCGSVVAQPRVDGVRATQRRLIVAVVVVVSEVVAVQANAASWARSRALLLLLLGAVVGGGSAAHSATGLANAESVCDAAGVLHLLVSVARLRASAGL